VSDQNGGEDANGLSGGGVRVSAPPVIERKKGLLGKKQETMSPYDVVPNVRPGVYVIKLFSFLMVRPNKLECLYLANTFQSSLTFAGNTRSLPKKEASERHSNWVCSGLALKF
jgi:hypothetical protein